MTKFTQEELAEMRSEAFADDVAIADEMMTWSRERVVDYFESAGESENPEAKKSMFEVVGRIVNMRIQPTLTSNKVGERLKGERFEVDTRKDG